MGMVMFQVTFNPEVLSVLHGSLPIATWKLWGALELTITV